MKTKTFYSQNDHLTAFFLAMAGLLVLFTFQCEMQEGDSLSFAYDISIGKGMAHPHHLLFSPIVWVIFKIGNLFTGDFSALGAAKFHNILWGTAGIVMAFYTGLRLFQYRFPAVLLSLLMLVSLHYVIFSSICEVYIPGIACLVIVFYLCLPQESVTSKRNDILSFLFLSMAILYNQANILIVPALFLFYFLDKSKSKRIIHVLFAGLLILAIYIGTYIFQESGLSVSGFVQFVFAYLVNAEPDWGTVSNLSMGGVLQLLQSQLSVIVNIEPDIHQASVLWFGALLIIAFEWHIRRCFQQQNFRNQRILLVVWLLSYYIFILWWTPGYELLIPMIFPLLLMFAWMAKDVMDWISEKVKRVTVKIISLGVLVIICGFTVSNIWLTNYPVIKKYNKGPDPAKIESDWDMKHVEPGYQIIQGYGPQIGLLYYHHFTDCIEVDRFLSAFFLNEELKDYLKLKPGHGRIIPIWFLNPYYESNGTTGIKQPKEWMAFFKNLFEYKKMNGDTILMNRYNIILPEENSIELPLVKIYPEPTTFPSLQAFMNKLDSTVIALGMDKVYVYTDMLNKQNGQ